MTEQALYKATVLAPHNRYRRSGVGFMQGENEVEVTAEQLEAIHADPLLKVMEAEEAEKPAAKKAPAKKAAAAKPAKQEAK